MLRIVFESLMSTGPAGKHGMKRAPWCLWDPVKKTQVHGDHSAKCPESQSQFDKIEAMDELLEYSLGPILRERGLTVAFAESCTGGLVGHRMTNVPGSSDYYWGSVTAYAYEAKAALLSVNWDTLNSYGAVSSETVKEMAEGIRKNMGSDIGVSISGIAGPGGGTEAKPVGLVWFGLSAADGLWSRHFVFQGDRAEVKGQAAESALEYLSEYLAGELA